jgi:hypothetical protein
LEHFEIVHSDRDLDLRASDRFTRIGGNVGNRREPEADYFQQGGLAGVVGSKHNVEPWFQRQLAISIALVALDSEFGNVAGIGRHLSILYPNTEGMERKDRKSGTSFFSGASRNSGGTGGL